MKTLLAIPGLLEALEQLCTYVLDQIRQYQNEQLKAQFDQGIQNSTAQKNTAELENLFDPDKPKT